MKKSAFLCVAIAAGSVAWSGLFISRAHGQSVPGAARPAEPPVDPNKVVITIGATKVTAGEFQTFVDCLPPEAKALASSGGRRQLGEEFVRLKILAAEAERRRVQDSPAFQQQMQIMRDNLMVGLLAQQIGVVDDRAVKDYYDAHKDEFEQVKARHILIPVDADRGLTDAQALAKAQDIRRRIQAGEKFADVAKAESGDTGTKDEGGDLQPFTRGVMVPEFEKAAFALKPGELSQPVKTEFGYHIILVEKHDTPALDQVQDAIADKLRQQKFEQFYDKLKDQANPKLDDTYFPPAKDSGKGQ